MKTQNFYSLLKPEDILNILSSGKLFEKASFHYIEKESKTYDQKRDKSNFLSEANLIYEKYKTGHTIIIKNLEGFNLNIRKRAAQLGANVDVHMYLVPPSGESSFPFHQDEKDVVIHMVYGEKTFILKNEEVEKSIHLQAGDELKISKDTWHRAIPQGASCLLSFGIPREINYEIPTPFIKTDFGTHQVKI